MIDYFTNKMENDPLFEKEMYEVVYFPDQIIHLGHWDMKDKVENKRLYSLINDDLCDDYIHHSKWLLMLLKIRDNFTNSKSDYLGIFQILSSEHKDLKYSSYLTPFLVAKYSIRCSIFLNLSIAF